MNCSTNSKASVHLYGYASQSLQISKIPNTLDWASGNDQLGEFFDRGMLNSLSYSQANLRFMDSGLSDASGHMNLVQRECLPMIPFDSEFPSLLRVMHV